MTTAVLQLPLASSSTSETDTLAAALALRNAGFAVHWLYPGTKQPAAGKGWQDRAVASVDQLRATYRNGMNLGLRTGEPSRVAGMYAHIFDVDVRIADLADEAWAEFDRMLPGVRATLPSVVSGSGGESRHLHFLTDKPFSGRIIAVSAGKHRSADGVEHNDWEIDLFGTGRQVAMPPSIHPDTGLPYRWEREWDLDGFDQPIISSATVESLGVAATGSLACVTEAPRPMSRQEVERALQDIPLDAWNERPSWLSIGQGLHHQFGGSQDGFDLWMRFSATSTKHLKKSSVRAELRRYQGFGKHPGKPVTMGTILLLGQSERLAREQAAWISELPDLTSPETGDGNSAANDNADTDEFSALLLDNDDEAVFSKGLDAPSQDGVVARMNQEHAVVMHGGRVLIASETRDGAIDFGTPTDIHTFYENKRIAKAGGREGQTEPVSKYWLRHPDRRTYRRGVVFSPGKDVPKALNLWRGWAVTPKPSSSCERFLDHVRNVVCRGDQAHADYVLGWMAHLVQHPAEKPGVALVLRGGKGAGKDTVADYLTKMIGRRHAPTVSHDKHIVGNFNRRLEAALLFHVQEGTWAGNHQAESVLKYLVTSETIEIERKGIDSFSLSSFLRLFISSNADWVVPASADERRWAIFNVSDARRGDEPYFRALRAEMDGNGPAALLAWLQAYDLSGFNVRAAPETAGLLDEKVASLRGIHKWWLDALSSGAFASRDGFGDDWQTAPCTIACTALRADYEAWSRTQKFEGNALGERQFGAKLRELVPSLEKKRQGSNERTWAYVIPQLDACRSAFNGWIGGIVDWT